MVVTEVDMAERDWRWDRVRTQMCSRGIDLLIVLPESNPTDVLYLANELGAVLFPLEDEPLILLGGEGSELAAHREAWIKQRESTTEFGSNRVPYGSMVADRLRARGLGKGRVALAGLDGNDYSHVRNVEGYLIYSTVVRILEALGDAEAVDGAPVMAAARHVKSEVEIAELREGCQVAEAGARAMGKAFRIGAEQADAYRAGVTAMMQPGLPVPSIAWCPGAWGTPRPRVLGVPSGTVTDGLCVSAEIILGHVGSMVQITEPFIAGRIRVQQRSEFELNLAAFEAARTALVPGQTWRALRNAVLDVALGTDYSMCFLLHSGWDGPLFVPNEVPEAVLDDTVQEGSVFICKPTAWPTSTGRYNARSYDASWGDMLVVRKDGAERLGTRPQQLISYG